MAERGRVAHLLRQTANAIAAPRQVSPNRWHGHDEAFTTMSIWSLLDALATVPEPPTSRAVTAGATAFVTKPRDILTPPQVRASGLG